MAKLYWRVKRNGKWTWTPAVYSWQDPGYFVLPCTKEEEE